MRATLLAVSLLAAALAAPGVAQTPAPTLALVAVAAEAAGLGASAAPALALAAAPDVDTAYAAALAEHARQGGDPAGVRTPSDARALLDRLARADARGGLRLLADEWRVTIPDVRVRAPPSAALAALHERLGLAYDPAELVAFDALPEPAASDFSTVVHAFLLRDAAPTHEAALAAHLALALAAVDLSESLAASQPRVARYEACPPWPASAATGGVSIRLDLANDVDPPCFLAFQIDLGGNDLYTSNSGSGVGALGHPLTAFLLDVLGRDRYQGTPGQSAVVGSAKGPAAAGLLVDGDGTDVYAPLLAGAGAVGVAGADGGDVAVCACVLADPDDPVQVSDTPRGALAGILDLGGWDDTYAPSFQSTGTGNAGAVGFAHAFLYDLGGGDAYRATGALDRALTANAGAREGGRAALLDGWGYDRYELLSPPPSGPWYSPIVTGNGGAFDERIVVLASIATVAPASALLADSGGVYWVRATLSRGAANGAVVGGGAAALLVGGSEFYATEFSAISPDPAPDPAQGGTLRHVAANGAAWSSGYLSAPHALLYSGGSVSNTYRATLPPGAANGAALAYFNNPGAPFAALVDAGGDDRYEAHMTRGAANGAFLTQDSEFFGTATRTGGVGLLLDDGAGADTYLAQEIPGGLGDGSLGLHAFWSMGGAYGGAGLLRDDGGNDAYVGDNGSQGSGRGAGIGVLVDQGGVDTHGVATAGLGRYSQGFGSFGGAGFLLDLGADGGADAYTGGDVLSHGWAARSAVGVLFDEEGPASVSPTHPCKVITPDVGVKVPGANLQYTFFFGKDYPQYGYAEPHVTGFEDLYWNLTGFNGGVATLLFLGSSEANGRMNYMCVDPPDPCKPYCLLGVLESVKVE